MKKLALYNQISKSIAIRQFLGKDVDNKSDKIINGIAKA